MRAFPTRLDGTILIERVVHSHERGFFQETYRRDFQSGLGVDDDFVEDNQSR